MAHEQKAYFVFRRNGRVHLNRRGRQFSRLLAAKVCASAVVMLDTPCSEIVWRILATHSIRRFPLHFPARASPCVITLQLDYTNRTEGWLGHEPVCCRTPLLRNQLFSSCQTSLNYIRTSVSYASVHQPADGRYRGRGVTFQEGTW